MLFQRTFLPKIGVYGVLVIAFLFTLTYFQKKISPKDEHLFLMIDPPVIALDQKTFNDEFLFQRATLLTSPTISLKFPMRQFSKPILAMASSIQKPEKIYLSQGFNLIQISETQDRILNLSDKVQNPISALSTHPLHSEMLYAVTNKGEFYIITISDQPSQKPLSIKSKGVIGSIPQNAVVEEMWTNPVTSSLTLALSQGEDSILIEMDPENILAPSQELILPNVQVRGGFFVSQQLMLLLDVHYHLHIVDWEKQTLIGEYIPNQNFQNTKRYQVLPTGFTLSQSHVYLSDQKGMVSQLSWEPNNNVIVLNRDIQFKKGKVILSWKTPVKQTHALYLGEISLTPRSIASPKKRILPFPPEKSQVFFGPLKKTRLEIPMIETTYRSLDISLLAVHPFNGKMISPAVTFTVDTEKGVK